MSGLILQDWSARGRAFFRSDSEQPFLFVPVCFGAGIASYFSLSSEPSLWITGLVFTLVLSLLFYNRTSYPLFWFLSGLLLFVAGVEAASIRSLIVSAPVLQRSLKNVKIMAVVQSVEVRPSNKWRLTLRPLSISRLSVEQYPKLLRLSARNRTVGTLYPGQVISFSAALFRPSRPSVPQGYDFARRAWFQRIGAVGYITSRITRLQTMKQDASLAQDFLQIMGGIRQEVATRVRGVLPGQEGALATALLTGERGGISKELYDDIRHSGLAHLLAISGLHMAVMAGTLFWLVHMLLALSSRLALSWPIRKWAVLVSFVGATFYLFLSGAGIATQRAYIMLIIGFLAILFDRPALTLRNLALAACLILLLFPETVLQAGFQMSFATTAALISFYEYRQSRIDKHVRPVGQSILLGRASRFIIGIFMTSLIAGFAVIPFAAFHFHQIAVYSLAGNMLVMPVFVFIIMPMALASLVLMPFGLEAFSLKVMAFGLSYIIDVSAYVASWQGAVYSLPVFPISLLVLMTFGSTWLVLLKGNIRFFGIFPFCLGLYLALSWQGYELLLDEELKAISFRISSQNKTGGRTYYLLKLTKKKSRLEQWLKFSGRDFVKYSYHPNKKQRATTYQGLKCDPLACIFSIKGYKVAVVKHRSALLEECQKSDIVILNFPLRNRAKTCPQPIRVISRTRLRKKGAQGLSLKYGQVLVVSVTQKTGQRPWSYRPYKWKPAADSKKRNFKRVIGDIRHTPKIGKWFSGTGG